MKSSVIEFKNKFKYLIDRCKVENCKNGYIIDPTLRPFQEVEEKVWNQCECFKNSILQTRLYEANVPQEYYNLTINDFDIRNNSEKAKIKIFIESVCNNIPDFYEKGSSLFLYGTAGSGKTMLSVEILKKAIASKYSVYYDFFPSIVDAFKQKGYVADDEKARYAKIFSEVDFLVIDELGKETAYSDYSNKDFSASKFLEINILKKRNLKPTIIITNMDGMEDVKKKYGQFVNSMMQHRFKEIGVISEDFRLKSKK